MNEYLEYLKKIDALPEKLKQIVTENWDDTGRPKDVNTESNAIIQVLNKNASVGFMGFKLDMNKIFENERFSDHQLGLYYNVFVAGASYIKDRMNEENIHTPENSAVKKIKM